MRADGSRRRAPLGGCLIVRELGRRLSLQNIRHNLILNLLSAHLSDVLDVVLLFDSVHDESVASGLAGKARSLYVVGLLRRRSRIASSSRVLLDQGARPGGRQLLLGRWRHVGVANANGGARLLNLVGRRSSTEVFLSVLN